MSRAFLIVLAFLFAPVSAWAADCSQSSTMLEEPTVPKDQERKACSGSAVCEETYKEMWAVYQKTNGSYAEACTQITGVSAQHPGLSADKLAPLMTQQTTTSVTSLDANDSASQKAMQGYYDRLLTDVQNEANTSDQATQSQMQNLSSELKKKSTLSKSDLDTYVLKITKTNISGTGKANLIAAARTVRFKTSISEQTSSEKTRLGQVAETQKTLIENNNGLNTAGGGAGPPKSDISKGDSGFGMSDAMKYAPLLAAVAPLAAMMEQKSSSSSDTSAANSSDASAASSTQAATLPTAMNTGSTSPGSAGAGTSFSEGTAASSTPNKTAAKAAATDSTGAAAPEALRALASNGQFSGSLGGTPFSGSSSSAGGAGLGASSSDSKSNGDANSDTKKVSDPGFVVASGGSTPSFAGSPATTAVDNSLKDLFKNDVMPTMPDPKAMFPGMDGTAPGAVATAAGGEENFSGVMAGGESGGAVSQGSIPGANDTRSLFVRMHDFSHRCMKKGCVTSEAGGKI